MLPTGSIPRAFDGPGVTPAWHGPKWPVYALPTFLLGCLHYTLMATLVNPLLAPMTAEVVGRVYENGSCEEVDLALVDGPFKSDCTVQADDNCVMEGLS